MHKCMNCQKEYETHMLHHLQIFTSYYGVVCKTCALLLTKKHWEKIDAESNS